MLHLDIDLMIASFCEVFTLEPEDDVSAFLGIKFECLADGAICLTQPHLIQHILGTVFPTGCNMKKTLASTVPVHADTTGALCSES